MSSSIPNIPPPADQIRSLMEMEHRIPNLLTLLSSALTALLPPDPDAPQVIHEDGSVQEEEERFVDSAKEYYQELDDITLLLRSTIHHLRLTRVLPTPNDFVPPPPNQLPPTPFSAPIPTSLSKPSNAAAASSDSKPSTSSSKDSSTVPTPSLGLYGLRVEAGSWRKMRDSLLAMKGGEPDQAVVKEVEMIEEAKEETAVLVQEAQAETSPKELVDDEEEDEDEEMEEVPEVVAGSGMDELLVVNRDGE
ncbi:hypothetical protein BDY24DRAFT_414428 [Mrakia frigida]|uniref:uncharacterized protein n=1 Tax=Mrakia frigida TaxID=29902 RepID=UPI003FCC0C90